ncbi:hypothetical protein [Roseibium sp.]|uniref:hypothetical protein n=1 Tax=Roseibium sp. TaxID=1936156 RepID=UPI003A9860AC
MLSYSFLLTISNFPARNETVFLQVHPDFRPPSAFDEPTRGSGRIFLFISTQPHYVRPGGKAGPRGKGFLMTFDLERYRAHIAPLNLPREQEDEMLRDLWAMTEALIDLTIAAPTYPLQLAITKQAFDAIEEALALVSEGTTIKEEAL